MIRGLFFKLYGLTCYILGMISLIAFILFANNGFVDVSLAAGDPVWGIFAIDIAGAMTSLPPALNNIALIVLFGLQHSIMARKPFKAGLTKIMPAPLERSTYVLATALVIFTIILFWRPMTEIVWSVSDPILRNIINAIYWLGWIISLLATQMIDGSHLMGLRQSFNPDKQESQNKQFMTPLFYKFVRHPIQTGIVISMLATPDMTEGRAILAAGIIIYIFIGLYFEERDLITEFGDTYRTYKNKVPGLFPRPGRRN